MKFVNSRSIALLISAVAGAGLYTASAQEQQATRPVFVVPRAQVQDGSNASRAPFPARRQNDDVTAPNGQALELNLPPNTPATQPPAPAAPTVAVLQRDGAIDGTTINGTIGEPALSMTGRPSVGVAVGLEPTKVGNSIRTQSIDGRDALLKDIETRIQASSTAAAAFGSSQTEMAASGREQYKTASADLEAKATALRNSVNAARQASAEQWNSARMQLAADYDAYVTSARAIDTAAGLPTVRN